MQNNSKATPRATADAIAQMVREGKFAPGAQLPTERAFAEAFAVSRATVNNALALLAREGVIVSPRRRRCYVHPVQGKITRHAPDRYRRPRHEQAGLDGQASRGPFEKEIRAAGYTPSWSVAADEALPPAVVARIFDAPAGQEFDRRSTAMHANGHPVLLSELWTPLDVAQRAFGSAPDPRDARAGTGPKNAAGELLPSSHTEDVEVRFPLPGEDGKEGEAARLLIPETAMVIAITRVTLIQQAKEAAPVPVQAELIVLPASVWQLRNSFTVED